MRPRADDFERRGSNVGQKARDRVGVAVRPAANRERRRLDRAPILADRAVLP